MKIFSFHNQPFIDEQPLGELIEKHVNSVACTILLCTTHGHFAKTEEEKRNFSHGFTKIPTIRCTYGA